MSPLDAYRPPQFSADIDLDLSRNEGRPWPLSDSAFAIDLDAVSRYPETTPFRLAVAARHGIDSDRVLLTAGGDDALGRCFASRAGATAVTTTPGFEMIGRYSRQTGGTVVEVDWWDGDFPVAEFLDAARSASMAVIVSPNNPTGGVVTEAGLRKVADVFPFVVLDAAYADFADEDLTDAALAMSNVVVVRTLSKAFGLAGLRVGYLLGSPDAIAELSAFGSPYPVSGLSSHLAEAALAADRTARRAYIDGILEGRRRLTRALRDLGAEPLPSQGNFVLATDVDPGWLVPAAASLGVGLREFPDRPNLTRCVRITVPRDPDELDRLLTTLRAVLAPEGLIFDLDGVIADVSGSYREAIIATAAHFGVVVDQSDVGAAKVEGTANDDWELTRRLCLASGVEVS
ncbi:MAG: aminotransferase class I/II-fold pyridoxal phosphate-dependent enzyme, partial [Acidimicrobiia bacterium]